MLTVSRYESSASEIRDILESIYFIVLLPKIAILQDAS